MGSSKRFFYSLLLVLLLYLHIWYLPACLATANYFMFRSMFGGGHNRQLEQETYKLENEMGQEQAKTDQVRPPVHSRSDRYECSLLTPPPSPHSQLQTELQEANARSAALEARLIALERK